MKKLVIFILASLFTSIMFAQDMQNEEFRTVFGGENGNLRISGFGGPMMSFGTVDGDFAHMMGGGGGVIVNNFFFGGYGMGLTTPSNFREMRGDVSYTTPDKLGYGHGGIWTGFIVGSSRALHLSLSSQFGWGSIGIMENLEETGDIIFVVSPVVEVELNFSRYFKIGIGSTISFVNGIESNSAYQASDFLNPSVFLSFKFGWFE